MSEDNRYRDIAKMLNPTDVGSAAHSLLEMESLGVPNDILLEFVAQLKDVLQDGDDSDRVIRNIERFLGNSRSPQSWLALFEREPESLETLVQLFTVSQYIADILIADPEVLDVVRMTGGQPIDKSVLLDEIMAEVKSATDQRSVMRVLRDYRHRETLRIAYGDFVAQLPFETVTEQISSLTDAIVTAAVFAADRDLATRRPKPIHADGSPVLFSVIALGKLGGAELNYSSDIDLVFVYENPRIPGSGTSVSKRLAAADEYFQRLGQKVIKLLSESTSRGIAYRVDMRLRPYGDQGQLVVSLRDALNYYDSLGRTWERQVFVKARAIAGDIGLGENLIHQLQPWIYRRYLMRADITGIIALKRRIEQRSRRAGDDDRNVKTGHGGIRDIEYVIQFLQLLNGGDAPSVRCNGTLEAIRRLQAAQCLTAEEQLMLEENYRFLRRIEHYLQVMYDRQMHSLPSEPAEFRRIALRMGYRDSDAESAEVTFQEELDRRTDGNRRILDHLLKDAFEGDDQGSPESDLILDPEPSQEDIQSTLAPHGFRDPQSAYRILQGLAEESIKFLSSRRCRHFLSAIAPGLLTAISETPDPDATLISLANVSDSLGGKAVLWELFSANPPSMDLCVRLCASSPYLASILTGNPGMIDELLDSLMLDALPSHEDLSRDLDELCRNAVELAPILHSFKNSMHLRVGVRDILRKDSISETHSALSSIAEVCMEQLIHHEFHRLIHRLGIPVAAGSDQPAEFVVLAVGKIGGREPNYHSDLDVMFLFDSEGHTRSLVPNRRFESTTNRHFFNQLSQRVVQAVTRVGSTGKLYDLDVRLRPLGRSGELAITIDDLATYFERGGGQLWERQALCKARPIWGSQPAQAAVMQCVSDILTSTVWSRSQVEEIYNQRMLLQQGASRNNVKRGIGGTMDVEFVTQMLQLAHAKSHPQVCIPGTLEALGALREAGCIDPELADRLYINYEFLRGIESGIRLMNLTARHEVPSHPNDLERLAFLLGMQRPASVASAAEQASGGEAGGGKDGSSETGSGQSGGEPVGAVAPNGLWLAQRCRDVQSSCRECFEAVFGQWENG